MMNKAMFMDRLDRFNVSASTIVNYHVIYDKMTRGAGISKDELKERVSHVFFAGYVRGGRLVTNAEKIVDFQFLCPAELCRIPVAQNVNLVNMHAVRRSYPVNLKSFGVAHIYVEPLEDGTPCLTIADVVSQFSLTEVAKVKAFALLLKEDFAETGYLHLAKAYEFPVELFV